MVVAPVAPAGQQHLLSLRGVTSGYARTTVVRAADLEVLPGQVVALLGANGAGKTTLLKTIAGQTAMSAGSIRFAGREVGPLAPHRRAALGMCLIPEGRGVFPSLTVRENLELQAPRGRGASVDKALDAFPDLRPRLSHQAGHLSGGQQQMLALGRCFVASPSLVLVDEVSMGLAPLIVDEIFAALRRLAGAGVAVVLVEQYIGKALELAHEVYLVAHGHVAYAGKASQLSEETVLDSYMGTGPGARPVSPGAPATGARGIER